MSSKLRVDVLTIFPSMFDGPLTMSLMGRAQKAKILDIRVHNLRKWAKDQRHQKVDDRVFGGGAGMLLMADPVYKALQSLGGMKKGKSRSWVVYLSPQGKVLNQRTAEVLSKKKRLIVLCGHYEGIDERLFEWIDQEISIGDFVMTGGEIPAMALIDTVARLVPGVVGDPESLIHESFSNKQLDFPQYTRPQTWRGRAVPKELLSGHHQKIKEWRRKAALKQTRKKKPTLLKTASFPRRRESK